MDTFDTLHNGISSVEPAWHGAGITGHHQRKPMQRTMLTLQPAPSNDAVMIPSDEALLAGIKHRDGEAFAQLCHRHRETVRRVVSQFTTEVELQDRTIEAAFSEVWNRAPQFSAECGHPLGWILTIARRCASTIRPLRPSGPRTLGRISLALADFTEAAA
jgi:hypothetical protein